MTRPRPAVLFDLGNVLFCDPWETLLLTPGAGLADRMGLDRTRVAAAARQLWRRYSIVEADEPAYWGELGRALGVVIDPALVAEAEEALLRPGPHAQPMLASAAAGSRAVGIVSNNTSFWYAKQADMLGLDRYVDPSLVFLSCRLGVSKGSAGRGLLELAAELADPARSLVVEDRTPNVERAAAVGFEAVRFCLRTSRGEPAPGLLERISA
ncbi:HAD family hydrolase [Streptomyces sp. NPDC127110]|uniref:HAD family hydrolase n=1 Tax=Streptomyces sp. NPDC127110 TaxID=3345362 RepID=UPI003639EEC0